MLKRLSGQELRLKRNHARLLDHQHKPRDLDLRTWLLLGGRGSGKTFAGSVWVDKMARKLSGITIALVGPALHDVREVMVEGASGIKALAEPGDRPRWEAGRRRLEGGPSPDRADALVWAVSRLMLGPQSAGPRVRGL
ncbi:MAG: terminase large subunit domain-containing protein [Brevundimonas sp.]|uniref:terminase large subunit domain-containing protein n=1 Tax=Brevundimonas sp. TaxID=1871086 RepID=UPI00391B18F8